MPVDPFVIREVEDELRRIQHEWAGTLRWTINAHTNVLIGFTVRTSWSYEDVRGERRWIPGDPIRRGLFDPITLHPIRGHERTHNQDYANQGVCAYRWGLTAMRVDGLIVPVLFTIPEEADKDPVTQSAWKISTGLFFVGQRESRQGVCPAGLLCAVISAPTPPWAAAHFDSGLAYCGIED